MDFMAGFVGLLGFCGKEEERGVRKKLINK